MSLSYVAEPESQVRRADCAFALETLRALPTALLVVSADGVVQLANRRACETLERARHELEGARIEDHLGPLPLLVAEAAGRSGKNTIDVHLPSGGEITLSFSASEIDEPSAPSARMHAIVLEDVTDVERVREERDRLLRIAAINELLPSILHELKNPLAAISVATELLVEEAESDATRATARAILNEVRRMKLNLDGIGAVGRSLKSSRSAAVDHVIREAFVVLDAQARAKGILTRCEVVDMPLLPLDPSVVAAMTFNLLNNAIQACREGDMIALVARLGGGGRDFVMRVDDTGSGMAADVLARCRELFFTTKRSGTGIGLTLCERAVTEAGGRMDIDSAPGRGTCISLRVPVGRR